MPNFYYYSVKEKLSKNLFFLHIETLAIDYEFCKKVNKSNFEFGTTFILCLISKCANKMFKNEAKLVKISFSLILWGVYFLELFRKVPQKGSKLKFLLILLNF